MRNLHVLLLTLLIALLACTSVWCLDKEPGLDSPLDGKMVEDLDEEDEGDEDLSLPHSTILSATPTEEAGVFSNTVTMATGEEAKEGTGFAQGGGGGMRKDVEGNNIATSLRVELDTTLTLHQDEETSRSHQGEEDEEREEQAGVPHLRVRDNDKKTGDSSKTEETSHVTTHQEAQSEKSAIPASRPAYEDIAEIENELEMHDQLDHRALRKAFLDDGFMSGLADIYSECIRTASESKSCLEAQYLVEMRDKFSKYAYNGRHAFVDPSVSKKVFLVAEFTGVEKEPTYAVLFEDFICKNRPFKGKLGLSTNSSELSPCSLDLANRVTSDLSLRQCPSYLNSSFIAPKIAVNNYLHRFPGVNVEERDMILFDYAQQWPALMHVKNNALLQCPTSLHMVLWLPNEVISEPITFHLYRSNSLVVRFDEKPDLPLHYNHVYATPESSTKFAPAAIKDGEFLFVPQNMVVQITSQGKQTLFRSCVLDASNLNLFRKQVHAAALVSSYEASVARFLHSSSFEKSMLREPKDVPWEQLLSIAHSTGLTEEEVQQEEKKVTKKSRRGKKGSKQRVGFKDWQVQQKWTTLITSLTMPVPNLPSVLSIGRTNISVEWIASYVPATKDSTRFGFNMTLCTIPDTSTYVEESCLVKLLERTSANEDMLERIDRKKSIELGQDVYKFSTVFYNLFPDTQYRFKINSFYGDHLTPYSPWSQPVTTSPLTTPTSTIGDVNASSLGCTKATLTIPRPIDDGGLAVLGYHVFMQTIQGHLPSTLAYVGEHELLASKKKHYHVVGVSNLLSNVHYTFRVSPYNQLGNSTQLSLASKPMLTLSFNTTPQDLIVGSGGTEGQPTAVLIDDSNQKIVCNGHTIEAWSGFYSPRLFLVSAEFAFVEENEDVSRKIAVISRGQVPLVFKIQDVQEQGALGVVILTDCDELDQVCAPGGTKAFGEFWGLSDKQEPYQHLRIPHVMIKRSEFSLCQTTVHESTDFSHEEL